jgi:hypothetical protein
MANISYIAAGKKNSKKNPAKLTLNIHLDCGETVSLDLLYKKGEGWLPAEDASSRAVYLYCVYVSHDRCWTDALLQNYINAYYNQVVSYHREAVLLKLFETHSQWRYSFGKKNVEILWWSLEKEAEKA